MKKYPAIYFNLLVLIAGALLPFAFAPFAVYPLAIVSAAALLIAWLHSTPKQALFRGFLFGLSFFGIGIYWIYISIHVYGNAPVALSVFITFLLVAVMSFYMAVQGYLFTKLFPKNTWYKLLLAYPLSWIVFEWVRGALFSGFPWLVLGYSQIDAPLRGLAPIFGVFGVSFAIVFSSAALVCLYLYKRKPVRILIAVTLAILWLGSLWLSTINWTKAEGEAIKVSLIQGNIPQEMKWQPNQLATILGHYLDLTKKTWGQSRIIIWPEAAIPAFSDQIPSDLQRINKIARDHKITVITGIPITDKENRYYNGILALGMNHGQYLKRHLVPFGEYIPLHQIFDGLFKMVDIPMSEFSRGARKQSDLMVDNILIAPFICYEIAYTSLVLDYMPQAKLLLTISDDSWFDRSIALAQHLQIARMRSLEVGRYQLVASNTGFTVIIDPKGNITAKVPPFDEYILTGEIEPMVGETPFVFWMHNILYRRGELRSPVQPVIM